MEHEIKEIITYLYSFAPNLDGGCDRCTWDSGRVTSGKIAVTCFPTVHTILSAEKWGAELMITHEPLFYNHADEMIADPVADEKRRLLKNSGMTVWRWHDHAHAAVPDAINEGLRLVLGSGAYEEKDVGLYRPVRRFTLDHPLSAREILSRMASGQGQICGCADIPLRKLSLCCGFAQAQHIIREIASREVDAVIAGEALQWSAAEYARDACQLGYQCTLILGGHALSEEFGMRLLSSRLQHRFWDCDVQFFESGSPFL